MTKIPTSIQNQGLHAEPDYQFNQQENSGIVSDWQFTKGFHEYMLNSILQPDHDSISHKKSAHIDHL